LSEEAKDWAPACAGEQGARERRAASRPSSANDQEIIIEFGGRAGLFVFVSKIQRRNAMGDFDITTGGELLHRVSPEHRIIDDEGVTIGDIVNSKDFGWAFYPKVDLEPEEKVLANFWISEGPWKLRAVGKFFGGTTLGAIAWLKLRAESNGQSVEQPAGPSSSNQFLCILRTNFGQPALVTLSVQGSAMGPCSISDIHFSAYREA
jgi:hypothetical protein